MTSKHTPGPWRVTERDQQRIETEDEWIVAEAYGPTGARGEQEANARLIAKAPELVEALQAFLAFANFMPYGPPGQAAIARARALLAEIDG